VIISGRRKSHLDSVAKANPGIAAVELDIADPDSIKSVAKKLTSEHPDLNVLINNAGIMEPDQTLQKLRSNPMCCRNASCFTSGVRVLEVAPPWVRTELMNSQGAKQAMPLDRFIAETLDVLETDADEILVEAAKPLRANSGTEEHALVNEFNQQMLKLFTPSQA
jgi:short-subunit dehydrogenase involved in D-alanine esterification of teichoic acids